MTAVISPREVVYAIDGLMEGFTSYLNRQTGEVYTVTEEGEDLLEEDVDPEDVPEWQLEELPKIREVLESEDWLPLPDKFEVHEWSIMERFSSSLADADLRSELLDAIHGSGAFRYFKDRIHRYGIQDSWFEFRMAALEQIAVDWLEEHGLTYERDQHSSSRTKKKEDS